MKSIQIHIRITLMCILFLSSCSFPDAVTSEPEKTNTDVKAEPDSDPEPTEITFEPTMAVIGPEEIVFDWTQDACEPEDIPDLPARAFRDSQGQVHLISSHLLSRAKVGSNLNDVTHECDIIMVSGHDGDPAQFNDNEWIAATYTEDGETIYAIIHNEYHGWEHDDCDNITIAFECWYNSLTLAVSYDGGNTFDNIGTPPEHFVAGLPYFYEAGAGPYGTMEPSNILKGKDGFYYQFIRIDNIWSPAQWLCLQRTDDLSNPDSWRAWDGEGFNMRFISLYEEPDVNPSDHICEKISPEETGLMVHSLTYNTYLDRYVLLGVSADHIEGRETWGVYYSFSEDLIHWTKRQLLWERELTWTWQSGDDEPISYPTLIDPDSPSLSFDITDNLAYLYYTKFNAGSPLDRDLIRVPVEFFTNEEQARNADSRTDLNLTLKAASENSVTIEGSLTAINGSPLANETIDIYAKYNDGVGEYYEYQLSGKIPPDANRAILGYRSHIECDCVNNYSEIWLYDMQFEMSGSGTNLVPNSSFANGLSGTNLWNGANLANVEASDRDSENMLHIQVDSGQSSAGDLASFQVTGGETYITTFSARVPPASENTGFFVLVFLGNSGELVRHPFYFHSPAIPIGQVLTGTNGNFEFIWDTPVNNSTLEAVFKVDANYLPSDATISVTFP